LIVGQLDGFSEIMNDGSLLGYIVGSILGSIIGALLESTVGYSEGILVGGYEG